MCFSCTYVWLCWLIGHKFQWTHRTARPRSQGSWLPCASKDNKGIFKMVFEKPTLTLTATEIFGKAAWVCQLKRQSAKQVQIEKRFFPFPSNFRESRAASDPRRLVIHVARCFQECGNGFWRCCRWSCLFIPFLSWVWPHETCWWH